MSGTKTVRLTIDGLAVRVAEGTSVLGAAEGAGVAIPHFCYHPAFAAEGSCRMCLVEIEGLPKLELSCSTAVKEGMVVRTSTPRVRAAREDVLEFLLADHPLDCPICDKAGECRLQDHYEAHGLARGRFAEAKRKKDKLVRIGKGLVLDRERCILCTRCVRFLRAVTGTGELGVFERGDRAEIGVFEGAPVDNDYSGNLVDICPVGAITDSDFRFKTRAWLLDRRPTVCPLCGRGCAVVVESVSGYPLRRGERRVFRVRARENPAVNGHWICDLGRAGRRAIDEDRLTRAAKAASPGEEPAWPKALADLAASVRAIPVPVRAAKIAVVLNSGLTCEELRAARKVFVDGLGLDRIFFADPPPGKADGLLLTSERVPNSRGVAEAGFTVRRPDLAVLAGTGILVVFGHHLAGLFGGDALAAALAGIPLKVLFASHESPLSPLADVVVPVAVPAEKSGTFVNVDGVRQAFGRAVDPAPGVPSELDILARLAEGLALSPEDAHAR
jgi:NADH-quinone oxidoreductase subunit G